MNRAEKRRQKKLAKKAATNAKLGKATTRTPKQQTTAIQQSLDVAVQHHNDGRLPEAEHIYQQILQDDPNHPVALHLLGVIAHQVGKHDIAVDFIKKALTIKPDFAEAHNNLGAALQDMGKLDEAMASYHKAISINPGYAEVHKNLGHALQDLGRLDEAVASYNKALAIKPDFAEAHNNLGITFQEMGKLDEAVVRFQKALDTQPDYAKAHNNLGLALQKQGKLGEAVASYRKAVVIQPDDDEAHNNLGVALQGLGKLDEAVASYHKALAIKPDYAEAHSNLGHALQDLGRLDEAVASHHKALAIKPDYAEAYNNLGIAFKDLGKLDEAMASYRKALALAIKPDYVVAGRNLLNVMLNVPGLTPEDLYAEHVRFSEDHGQDIARLTENFTNDPSPERRLRVGYLSSDLRNHPVGKNVLPLISSHDREKFEIFCYADISHPDAMTERFQSSVDHWHTIVGKSDTEVAKMMRADTIDVLVCLAGRFDDNRPLVCAHRAAPVQVSFHDGASSGLEEMDYWLTDGFLHPPDTKEMFTEELHRLPVFYQYPLIEDAPPVEALPADQAGFVTFGSFNNPAKVNEEVISLWARILQSVSGSKLLLKYKNLYSQASLQGRLLECFAASGIGPDRVLLEASHDTLQEHLGRYAGVDIALDPFPFNGATTTFQSLWMGVPVVSLAGETFISRAAGSMLLHVGLGDLAVDTPEAYVACARDLAGNLGRLKSLRSSLRDCLVSSPLCNAPAYARSVEAAYGEMWRKWCLQPKTSQAVN